MHRTALPTSVLALTALLLSACGGAEDTDAAAPAASAAASAPAADDPVVAEPPAIDGLEVLAEDPSHEHVEGPLEYDRVPPLGGEHNPRWLACDVYDEPVPHEFAVHSLEHGAVWLAHAPDLPADQVALLADLTAIDREYVLVSPEEGLDSRVVAVAWGAALEASSADDPGWRSSSRPTPAATRAASRACRAAARASRRARRAGCSKGRPARRAAARSARPGRGRPRASRAPSGPAPRPAGRAR